MSLLTTFSASPPATASRIGGVLRLLPAVGLFAGYAILGIG